MNNIARGGTTLRFSAADEFANLCPGRLDLLLTGMRVDVQRGGDVGVAADALNGLEIDPRFGQRGDIGMPENVGRCSV